MQVSWPPFPFSSLRAAGFVVTQGVVLCDRVDRDGSPATVHGAPALAVQHEQPQEPLRGGRPLQTATASSALRIRSRMRNRSLVCVPIGSHRLMVSFMDLLWGNLFSYFLCEMVSQSMCASMRRWIIFLHPLESCGPLFQCPASCSVRR